MLIVKLINQMILLVLKQVLLVWRLLCDSGTVLVCIIESSWRLSPLSNFGDFQALLEDCGIGNDSDVAL